MAHENSLKFCTVRGENRQRIIDEIRVSFSCPCTASLYERISALVRFHENHPEYPIAMLAEAGYVGYSALRNRLSRKSRSENKHLIHRNHIGNAIETLTEESWQYYPHFPSVKHATEEIRKLGLKCSRKLVSEIMRDFGYIYGCDELP